VCFALFLFTACFVGFYLVFTLVPEPLFTTRGTRIHHRCFQSNVVKHFGLDALHLLSHERQGRTSELQELHHFVFLLVSPVADALAPFHLGRERIGCMKLCHPRAGQIGVGYM
jgi:hypothetical protein